MKNIDVKTKPEVMLLENFRIIYTHHKHIDGGGNGVICNTDELNKVIKINKFIRFNVYDTNYKNLYDQCINSDLYKKVTNVMLAKNDNSNLPIANIYDIFFVHSTDEALYLGNIFSGEDNQKFYCPSEGGYMYMVTVMEKLSTLEECGTIVENEFIKIEQAKALLKKNGITPNGYVPMMRTDSAEIVLADYDDWNVEIIGELNESSNFINDEI